MQNVWKCSILLFHVCLQTGLSLLGFAEYCELTSQILGNVGGSDLHSFSVKSAMVFGISSMLFNEEALRFGRCDQTLDHFQQLKLASEYMVGSYGREKCFSALRRLSFETSFCKFTCSDCASLFEEVPLLESIARGEAADLKSELSPSFGVTARSRAQTSLSTIRTDFAQATGNDIRSISKYGVTKVVLHGVYMKGGGST